MMLSPYVRRHRIAVRSALTFSWIFAGLAGLSAATLTTVSLTVVRELGLVLTIVCGIAFAVGAGVATYGVAFDRYRFEWAGSWFAGFGISPYVVSLWAVIVSTGEVTRQTQALLVTSLLCFFLARALLCGAHAARLRALHEAGEVTLHAADDDDDSSGHSRP